MFHDAVVRPLSQFFLNLDIEGWIVLCSILAGAAAAGFFLGRFPASRPLKGHRGMDFQNFGEKLLAQITQENFGPPDYHLMNHVTLWLGDGTTEIDHILVSRYGVFVIETKDYKGWIFAGSNQPTWTQVLFHLKFQFQNPIHQNLRHVRAVQRLLDFIQPDDVKSAVVFTGNAEFKTEVPKGVFSLPGLIGYIRDHTDEVMSANRMHFCVGRLETARLAISGETDVEHIRSLERRHGRPA